ncbi:MAG: cupredoxin domain-containing protein [Acidimicrobiia bacterium]
MSDRERTTHGSLQLLGLTMMSLAIVTLIAVSLLILGDTEEIGLFVLVGVVSIAVTFVVWRFDTTWARIVGLIGALAVGAIVWWLAFGVFQIFSPIEFIVGLAMFLGILLALIWGVMALVSGMKDRVGPTRTDRALRTGVLGLIGVLSVVSIVGFIFTRETVSAAEAAGATSLNMVDFEFDPSETVTDGKLLIHNADPFAHDLTIEDLDVLVYVGPGSDAIVDLSSAAPGTYDYFCSLHTDPSTGEGMTGQITIEG